MNSKKAKALRSAMRFKPGAQRHYSFAPAIEKISILRGIVEPYVVSGTVSASGLRRMYQAVKRRGMAAMVLGAR